MIEHNLEVINADWIIDLALMAKSGRQSPFAGTPEEMVKQKKDGIAEFPEASVNSRQIPLMSADRMRIALICGADQRS